MRLLQGRTRWSLPLPALVLAASAAMPPVPAAAQLGASADVADSGTGLRIVAQGVALADPEIPSYRPALTRAPNGDLLAAYNTSSDVNPGGEIRMIRSTDGGQTWGTPRLMAAAKIFPGGSIHSGRGMSTLADGTILLPFNEGINYSRYNHRDSALFVGRSTDSGQTWEGLDQPIDLPVGTQEHWVSSRIIQLRDGSLLLPLWGTAKLVDGWQTDPMRWRSATVKSYDGGKTWTDYATVGYDPNSPPDFPRPDILQPYGLNEHAVVELADGRLLSIMRFNGSLRLPEGYRTYLSYSGDGGLSWSDPVASNLLVETPSLTTAPCTEHLTAGQAKLLFGYRDRAAVASGIAAVSVSFDNGATWNGQLVLKEPSEAPFGRFTSAEPDFLALGDGRVLVMFQSRVAPEPFKLAWNIIEDLDAPDCVAEAEQAKARAQTALTVHIQRGDRDSWPFGLARRQATFAPTDTVGEAAATAAGQVNCRGGIPRLVLDGRKLPPHQTLAQAGVRKGDTVEVVVDRNRPGHIDTGHIRADSFPGSRHAYAWSSGCDYGLTLDQFDSSIAVHNSGPGEVTELALRDGDGESRLRPENYSIWVSADNDTYTELTGWSFTAEVGADGRLVHRFTGLDITQPYIKIHQSYADAGATFTLNSLWQDVIVTVERGLGES